MAAGKKNILVTGDIILDHHIYQGNRPHFGNRRNRGVHEIVELGGAALIQYLLAELAPGMSQLDVAFDAWRKPVGLTNPIPDDLQAYAFWRPITVKEKDPDGTVWAVSEAMGFGGQPASTPSFSWPLSKPALTRADVVVISDGGMGFRGEKSRWPIAALNHAQWIVLKTSYPLTEGDLWKTLVRPEYRDKLVVIVTANELRKTTAQISAGLSWEQTLESVFGELSRGGALAELTQCRHVLIAFDTDGGLWLDLCKDISKRQAHLVYEASVTEGETRLKCKGMGFGMLSCLAAAVAWKLATNSKKDPDLESALEAGLSGMHDLLNKGHGRAAATPEGFPAKRLAKAANDPVCRYSRATFSLSAIHAAPNPGAKRSKGKPLPSWSVLREARQHLGDGIQDPPWRLAELVARRGPIALGSLPHLVIGNLLSADRREMESLRVLRSMIHEYKRPENPGRRPLSIGIFGPPGAGKSFAVKEIATTLLSKEGWMEFNLSQFKEGTDDLIGAFHQIRDRALKGILPVAFFDEFDSRKYGWLQYLLAPMQDGAFQEGQITHPIGKCIFIFAGGTSHTFETFGPPEGDADAYARFRLSKGPDFKSRLDGFLDVLGPNQRELVYVSRNGRRYESKQDSSDILYPIRRAIFIRKELDLSPADKLAIDPGLLSALLRTSGYRHGTRSLIKLLEPLKAARPGFLNRSLTPPRNQLALHVKDDDDFLNICRKTKPTPATVMPFDVATLEKVAEAIHETWRTLGRNAGWLAKKDDIDFKKLPEFLRDSNRAAAIRMVETLGLIGLALVRGKSADKQATRIRMTLEYHLELLAEAEHDGWMAWYLDRGWQWGPTKDDVKRTHPCLKPYGDLPDVEKNKDRDAVRHYLEFAERANMRITVAKKKRK